MYNDYSVRQPNAIPLTGLTRLPSYSFLSLHGVFHRSSIHPKSSQLGLTGAHGNPTQMHRVVLYLHVRTPLWLTRRMIRKHADRLFLKTAISMWALGYHCGTTVRGLNDIEPVRHSFTCLGSWESCLLHFLSFH